MAARQREVAHRALGHASAASPAGVGSGAPGGEGGGSGGAGAPSERGAQEGEGLSDDAQIPRVVLKFTGALHRTKGAAEKQPLQTRGPSWYARVASGRPLAYDAVDGAGKNQCHAYLRAMAEPVARDVRRDKLSLQKALQDALRRRDVGPGQVWSIAGAAGGRVGEAPGGGAQPVDQAAANGGSSAGGRARLQPPN